MFKIAGGFGRMLQLAEEIYGKRLADHKAELNDHSKNKKETYRIGGYKMTGQTQTEKLMEKIREILAIVEGDNAYPLEECEDEAVRQILSIPISGKTIKELIEGWQDSHLRELNPDQSLPDDGRTYRLVGQVTAYSQAQQDMLKEGWVKVLPK